METWREVQERSKQASEDVRAAWLDDLIASGKCLTDIADEVGVRDSTLIREAKRLGRVLPSSRVTDPEAVEERNARAAHLRAVYEGERGERMERATQLGEADRAEFLSARRLGTGTPIVRPPVTRLLGEEKGQEYRLLRLKGVDRPTALRAVGRADLIGAV